MKARWIRLGVMGQAQFDAAYAALAAAQPRDAAPVLVWAEEAARYPFALIAPLKFAPGRVQRWLSWGLAAAVATYRQFGVPAYLDEELVLHGRNIAQSGAAALGVGVLVGGGAARFAGDNFCQYRSCIVGDLRTASFRRATPASSSHRLP